VTFSGGPGQDADRPTAGADLHARPDYFADEFEFVANDGASN
jgi:hypothetical protein